MDLTGKGPTNTEFTVTQRTPPGAAFDDGSRGTVPLCRFPSTQGDVYLPTMTTKRKTAYTPD